MASLFKVKVLLFQIFLGTETITLNYKYGGYRYKITSIQSVKTFGKLLNSCEVLHYIDVAKSFILIKSGLL